MLPPILLYVALLVGLIVGLTLYKQEYIVLLVHIALLLAVLFLFKDVKAFVVKHWQHLVIFTLVMTVVTYLCVHFKLFQFNPKSTSLINMPVWTPIAWTLLYIGSRYPLL